MKKLIILFGAPGSGKGLIGDRLVAKTSMTKFSTGDFFRSEVKRHTSLGNVISHDVQNGIILDDDLVNTVVQKALIDAKTDIILDGYPRTFSQSYFLKGLVENNYTVICIHVNTSIKEILSRIGQRRICEQCGTTHFASQGSCPKCGGRSIIREDDQRIRERLQQYTRITLPILEDEIKYWCEVIEVNGMNIDESVANILATLKNI